VFGETVWVGVKMNPELIYITLMALGGSLFALGGTGGWSYVSKSWRRYGLPLAFTGLLILLGVGYWRVLGSMSLLSAALHLGYGIRKPYWYKTLVGLSYVLPSLFFGFTWWTFLTPIGFIVLFALSNWRYTQRDFVWKVVEFMTGAFIAITIIGALQRPW
jgi:hypothetical protein